MSLRSIHSTFDPRFSFSIYIPDSAKTRLPLVVVVHGISREVDGYMEGMRSLCEQHACALLCPLFPEGVPNPKHKNSYKELYSSKTRFDTILLSIIDQAAQSWELYTEQFYLHGFSGGGQFVHRFMYLHPDRLAAVSIGAPGRLTAPDLQSPWPEGIADVQQVFALPEIQFDKMASIPVQFVIGERDVKTSMIEGMKDPTKFEMEAGQTRMERIRWLKAAWETVGIASELTVVSGAGHDGLKCLSAVTEWLGQKLSDSRRSGIFLPSSSFTSVWGLKPLAYRRKSSLWQPNRQAILTHALAGIVGGLVFTGAGYTYYYFSGLKRVVDVSRQKIERFGQLNLLRLTVKSYCSVIPGSGSIIDRLFDEVDKVAEEHQEEVSKILARAQREINEILKKRGHQGNGELAVRILEVIGKHIKELGQLGVKAGSPLLHQLRGFFSGKD
ncbi:hypothetical protein D9757_005676 [Collybiopsis confluens]|uniref:Uncharacterized protein n=1 Tax=Collybiopsis confluens TaxID=2823264 RepID=A0A8H5HT93_9AGAR|nr:hypothetical protein D9757_005676 [Collybiopsis confluens]